jgi:hypothetical protein
MRVGTPAYRTGRLQGQGNREDWKLKIAEFFKSNYTYEKFISIYSFPFTGSNRL